MSYVSFNINCLSHTEFIERGVWSGSSQFAKKNKTKKKTTKNSLAIISKMGGLSLYLYLSLSRKYDMPPFEL